MGRRLTVGSLLLVAGACGATHRADACSAVYCAGAQVSPPEGATVPANVPALVVVAARGEKGYLPPTGIQLADSTSTAVATDVEAQSEGATYLVKPQASL